jgi:hypothetical protein
MAEAIKYVVVCGCSGSIEPIAFINDDRPIGGDVTITAARPGEKQIIAAKGYKPGTEDWRVPDRWVASKYPEGSITEIMWTSTDERESAIGWVVRCGKCGQQVQMKQTKLRAAADALAARESKDKASWPCPAVDDSSVTEIREIARIGELTSYTQ